MLNLVLVQAFVAVAEEGGFHAGARRLDRSQPTVSQQVRKLEAALGRRLIARGRAGCALTEDGRMLLPYARSLLAVVARARGALNDRRLAVAAASNIGIYILPPLLRRFSDGGWAPAPVQLAIDSNPAVAERLVHGEADAAVMEWWDGRPGFEARPWRREPLCVIVPPNHPWAALDAIDRTRLLDEPMIGGEPGTGTGRILARVFGDQARRLPIAQSLGSTEAVKQAVKAGLGISLTMAAAVEAEVGAGTLVALPLRDAPMVKELYVVVPEDLPPTAPAARFAAHLIDGIKREDATPAG